VHQFCADVVQNLRAQAAFVSGLLQEQKTDKSWKEEAETSIKQIQAAGNKLETKVLEMQDTHTLVMLDQADKNKASKTIIEELNAAVTQLQVDIVDQNDVNASQSNQIVHLEDLVTELVDRIIVLETKENTRTLFQ
jgi:hypothetical protein